MRVSPIACLVVVAMSSTAFAQQTPAVPVVRIRDVRREMDDLRAQLFSRHSQLAGIATAVLEGAALNPRAVIRFENDVSNRFRLQRVVLLLDGAPLVSRADDQGSLADAQVLPVFDGRLAAGEHTLTVSAEYRGQGYGLSPYADVYTFRVRSVQAFTVRAGSDVQLRVVGSERGDVGTPMSERLTVRYVQDSAAPAGAADASGIWSVSTPATTREVVRH